MTIFYKIYHDLTPSYLKTLLPPNIRDTIPYRLRSDNNHSQINTRTTTFGMSFIPQLSRKWNELDQHTRYIGSLQAFKDHLKSGKNKVPSFYYTGSRHAQIIHSRMRMSCSPLKHDLFVMHIIYDQTCQCGHACEDCFHFFFECANNDHLRYLFQQIQGRIQDFGKEGAHNFV